MTLALGTNHNGVTILVGLGEAVLGSIVNQSNGQPPMAQAFSGPGIWSHFTSNQCRLH
jgi:hypothetical protein